MLYTPQLTAMINAARFKLSDIQPSQWVESKRTMSSDVSPFPGKFSYNLTPYLREIIDTLHPGHPARIVAIMKGAQVGFSTGVIEGGLGYIIDQVPGPSLFLTGHADLTEEAMTGKIDNMIDSCSLRHLIKSNTKRKRSQRTGDTNTRKEFPGGYIIGGHANHKTLRQRSVKYGFFDDFEAMPSASKESGSTTRMIEQRFAAYADKMKIYYISTPEIADTSNIQPVYLNGDQRKYHIPCPCCGAFIALQWEVAIEGSTEKGGITWKLDDNGKLLPKSVGYICQVCAGFFTDARKYELNLAGVWQPTAEPIHQGYYSYHLSSLYAPPGMYNWLHYVRQYLEAYPPGAEPNEKQVQTFVNLCLGETYKPSGKEIKAYDLMKNVRNYDAGTVPETMSIADGNGSIVLLTCAVDANGVPDDARLDYEVVGWCENGSRYSITHGSIGTFVPREGSMAAPIDRERWTYQHQNVLDEHGNVIQSVWPELERIVTAVYEKDTGRKMKIMTTVIDVGYHKMEAEAWQFINTTQGLMVYGVKGKGESQPFLRHGADLPTFQPSRQNAKKLFIIESNIVKDLLADSIRLKWDYRSAQPHGFINFPGDARQYQFNNYFSHFEAEHRVMDTSGAVAKFEWKKKNSAVQNHLFDCHCYNLAARDILVYQLAKEIKKPKATWADILPLLKAMPWN